MLRRKSSIFLAAVFVVVVLIIGILIFKHHGDGQNNIKWGYEFTEVSSESGVSFLEHNREGENIKVTLISSVQSENAITQINEKIAVFSALFENQRVGYTGQQTEFVACPEEYKPSSSDLNLEAGTGKYINSFANNRLAVGICDPEDIAYVTRNVYLYCSDSQQFFEIDYFVPSDLEHKADKFVNSLTCE